MVNPLDLTGKHIVITGASSGIGRQSAIQASRLGAHVTLIARSEEKLRETVGQMDQPALHACYAADLSETDQIEPLVQKIVSQRGAVDGFCHAAGMGEARPIRMIKPVFVERMLRIHTYAFIELVRCLSLKGNVHTPRGGGGGGHMGGGFHRCGRERRSVPRSICGSKSGHEWLCVFSCP